MTDKIFPTYDLDSGTAAARPATPTPAGGRLYVYFATDTGAFSIWNGTAYAAWVSVRDYGNFTVAGLPAAATVGAGATAYVTDALAPAYNTAVAAGGAVKIQVISNGTNWMT